MSDSFELIKQNALQVFLSHEHLAAQKWEESVSSYQSPWMMLELGHSWLAGNFSHKTPDEIKLMMQRSMDHVADLKKEKKTTITLDVKKNASALSHRVEAGRAAQEKAVNPPVAVPRSRSGQKPSPDLENEIQQLRKQIELQKSQIAEARRVAARESQRYDQLLQQMTADRKNLDLMLDRLLQRNEDNRRLQSVLIARQAGRMRMTETYRGVVANVHSDEVTVVYDVDGDILEHTYFKSQFCDGQLPKEGDRLELTVHVSEIDADDLTASKSEMSDVPHLRKNLRNDADEF